MKTEAELYNEFFEWLDEKVEPIIVPKLFKELDGFTYTASDYLVTIDMVVNYCDKTDYYCDILFELWYKQTYGDKN